VSRVAFCRAGIKLNPRVNLLGIRSYAARVEQGVLQELARSRAESGVLWAALVHAGAGAFPAAVPQRYPKRGVHLARLCKLLQEWYAR
jgi:hypothetical protein